MNGPDPMDRELATPAPLPPELETKIRIAVGEVRPVKPLLPPVARAAIVSAIALGVVGLLADPVEGQPERFGGSAALAVLGFATSWIAMRLAVPGSGVPRLLALVFLGVPIAVALEAFVSLGTTGGVHGARCLVVGSAVAAAPFAAGSALVARGFATEPTLTGAIAGIGSGALAIIVLTLNCPISEGPHVAIFHAGVLVVSGVAGALAGVVTARMR